MDRLTFQHGRIVVQLVQTEGGYAAQLVIDEVVCDHCGPYATEPQARHEWERLSRVAFKIAGGGAL